MFLELTPTSHCGTMPSERGELFKELSHPHLSVPLLQPPQRRMREVFKDPTHSPSGALQQWHHHRRGAL